MAVLTNTSYQVFQIQLRYSFTEYNGTGKNMMNLFDYYCPSVIPGFAGNSASYKASLVTQFHSTCWTSVLQAAMSSQASMLNTQCRALDVPLDAFTGSVAPGAPTGPSTDRLPTNDAAVFQKLTSVRGRSARGSWHIAGVTESQTTSDEIVSGLGVWQACKTPFATTLSVTLNSVAYQFVPVLISASGSQVITAPTTITYFPITSVVLNRKIGTMRKRGQKLLASEPPTA